jgi:hypothetical protein
VGDAAEPRLLRELVGSGVCGQRGCIASGRHLLARCITRSAEPLAGLVPRVAESLAGGPGSIPCGPERIGSGLCFVARRHIANDSRPAQPQSRCCRPRVALFGNKEEKPARGER